MAFMSHRLRMVTLAAALLLVSAGFGAAPALAHTALAASSPADGEVLTTAPDTVSLTFTEPVQAEFTQVAVTDGSGSLVIAGETTVDGPLVRQPISLTANGTYTVAYRIVSADGHPVSGQLSFSYSGSAPASSTTSAAPPSTAAAPATPSPAVGTAQAADDGSGSTWWWPVVAAMVLAAAAAAVLLRTRRRHTDG
jgi:methionine-rich copper-binding protein CopC